MSIKTLIEEEVSRWELLGHPALMQRFVLLKGQLCKPAKRPKHLVRGMPKMCFQNSFVLAESMGLTYVEGYATGEALPGFLVHHGWCLDEYDNVVDVTWGYPEKCEYFGVRFSRDQYHEATDMTKCYSALDSSLGLNAEWMFTQCPELKTLVGEVRKKGNSLLELMKK